MKNNNRFLFIIGVIIAFFWLIFVFFPHFINKGKKERKNLLIFYNAVVKHYLDNKLERIIKADKYERDIKEKKGVFYNYHAIIFNKNNEVVITADTGKENSLKSIYILKGNVNVIGKDYRIDTQKAIYNERLDQLIAPQYIVLTKTNEIISGDFLEAYPKKERFKLKGNVKILLLSGEIE